MVSANAPQHPFLDGAVNGGDLRAHRFSNLHPMRSDAAASAIDQDRFSRANFCPSHEMERIQSTQRYGRGFLKTHIGGLGDDSVARW